MNTPSAEGQESLPQIESDDKMGRDEFTKILITQLQHQDPLDPMDDREFIVQMTQFSKLEQLHNLNESQERYSLMNMLGKHATARKDGDKIEGKVTGIKGFGSSPKLEIEGRTIELKDIDEVLDTENMNESEVDPETDYQKEFYGQFWDKLDQRLGLNTYEEMDMGGGEG